MKIIKYLFFLLLLIVIGGSVYIATIDGEYQIEESRIIDAPDELIFNTVNEYKTWEKWGPWMDMSDDLIMSYPNQTSGENASYSWKSETQGDGSMKTVKIAPFSSIDQKITFITPFGESGSDVYWKFEKIAPKKTKVSWGIKGEQSFMEKAFWVTQDSTLSANIRPMYKRGLEKLEAYMQKQMDVYTINVDGVTEHNGGYYMYSATASSITGIVPKIQELSQAVKTYIRENEIPQTGMPFTLYNEYNKEQGTAIFSVGIPTRDQVVVPNESTVLCNSLPQQKVTKITLTGDYKNLKEAWEAGLTYMAENNLEMNEESPAFEVYRINPDLNPNPAAWVTEIYIPVK
ncbi:GyrI-like domain-containing protein [Aquimarina hainanensis]|uniref:GyrI-like domain-containing protein n=1 Tax=Aquimarina hainanensis TaxID=1578017 RepID=A0ABW5N2K6_9FLAO|nr:GyrI-like domain-containing protein [Aquimarina sp. TRL1]QKX05877.1 AraC family transcriptional regulator [Aquimarina sp. TRL1]